MSKGDLIMTNEVFINGSENSIADNEIYKKLRRRSASLSFMLTILLPILLFMFNICCTPKRTFIGSIRHINDLLGFDLDCLAVVLGWVLIQVSIIKK